MKCPKCQTGNPDEAKFRMECAYELKFPQESHPINHNQPQSYTPQHLADIILTTSSSIEGERKLVTALSVDVATPALARGLNA